MTNEKQTGAEHSKTEQYVTALGLYHIVETSFKTVFGEQIFWFS